MLAAIDLASGARRLVPRFHCDLAMDSPELELLTHRVGSTGLAGGNTLLELGSDARERAAIFPKTLGDATVRDLETDDPAALRRTLHQG